MQIKWKRKIPVHFSFLLGARFHLSIYLIETEKSLTTKLAHDFQILLPFHRVPLIKSFIKHPGGLFISSPFEGGGGGGVRRGLI